MLLFLLQHSPSSHCCLPLSTSTRRLFSSSLRSSSITSTARASSFSCQYHASRTFLNTTSSSSSLLLRRRKMHITSNTTSSKSSSPLFLFSSRRPFSSQPAASKEGGGQEEEGIVIYKGGHGDVIRTLKRVSLTTCVIGLFSTPFFLALGSESVPLAANVSLTGIVLLATCGPTILLHAFTKPYIFTLRVLPPASSPDTDTDTTTTTNKKKNQSTTDIHFQAETMNALTRRKLTEFTLSDVKPLPNSTRPFVSFSARGSLYFVHGETFADKDLLIKLLGRPLKKTELVEYEPPKW